MMEPSPALGELLEQHAALRTMMEQCEQLADELDRGRGYLEALVRAVSRLRAAFEAHTRSEEQLLGSMVRDLGTFGGVRIDPTCADHVQEHRALAGHLGGPTAELRTTLDELRVHLAGEERYFLATGVLREITPGERARRAPQRDSRRASGSPRASDSRHASRQRRRSARG